MTTGENPIWVKPVQRTQNLKSTPNEAAINVARHQVDTVKQSPIVPQDVTEDADTAANRIDSNVRKLPEKQVKAAFRVAKEVGRRTMGLVMKGNQNEPPATFLQNPMNLIHDIERPHEVLQHRIAEDKIKALVWKWKRLAIEVARHIRRKRAMSKSSAIASQHTLNFVFSILCQIALQTLSSLNLDEAVIIYSRR